MQLFELHHIPGVVSNPELSENYNHLPADKFLKEKDQFRKRRYGTGKIQCGLVTWDFSTVDFQQADEYNSYVGNMQRKFEPIDFKIQEIITEKMIQPVVSEYLPLDDYSFGVHQIRITADEDYMGKPAPEGPHQDGYDYLSITCINHHNVVGGNTLIVDVKDSSKVFYENVLDKGDCLVINDRKLAHYASPIVPKLPGPAYRDVLVITFKKIERGMNA